MRIFKGYVKTNMVGSKVTFEFEAENDADEVDIDEALQESAANYFEIGWAEIGCTDK